MQKLKMLAVIAAFLAIPMTFGFSNRALGHSEAEVGAREAAGPEATEEAAS